MQAEAGPQNVKETQHGITSRVSHLFRDPKEALGSEDSSGDRSEDSRFNPSEEQMLERMRSKLTNKDHEHFIRMLGIDRLLSFPEHPQVGGEAHVKWKEQLKA